MINTAVAGLAGDGSNYRDWLGFREPVSQAEEGADFPAFIPALLDLA
jgi:hypothetical protein